VLVFKNKINPSPSNKLSLIQQPVRSKKMTMIKTSFFTLSFFIALIIFAVVSLTNPIIAAENGLREAISLHNDGRDGDAKATAEAITLLEDIIKAQPTNATALAYLGSSYSLTARDSDTVVNKMRYTNRGLRVLDQAVSIAPDDWVVRLIRANVASNLPALFNRKKTAIEDGLKLDEIFSNSQDPEMASHMVGIYKMLSKIADDDVDWASKIKSARKLSKSKV
jgi:hypothetical protein